MADANIIVINPNELSLITKLYNDIFNPPQEEAYFQRRFQGRHNISMLAAEVEREPVGFVVGYECIPTTYFSWLCGVMPHSRREGVATQLMQAQVAWAADHHYPFIRFECQNQHRPMLHLAIGEGYDLVGMRYDTDSGNNVAIFEKDLR